MGVSTCVINIPTVWVCLTTVSKKSLLKILLVDKFDIQLPLHTHIFSYFRFVTWYRNRRHYISGLSNTVLYLSTWNTRRTKLSYCTYLWEIWHRITFGSWCKSLKLNPQGWGPTLSLSPQEDLCALQVCSRGACSAFSSGPAGKDDDEAGIRLSETLHLRRWFGVRLRRVRMGPTWAQARTGNNQDVEQMRRHKLTQRTLSLRHVDTYTQTSW